MVNTRERGAMCEVQHIYNASYAMAILNCQALQSASPEEIISAIRHGMSSVFDEEPHDWQIQAISAILGGRDVVVSAATGSGKSRVFQVPALAVDGSIVLVVAPVKSLLRDQVHLHLSPEGTRT